jgi:hypothetical protein
MRKLEFKKKDGLKGVVKLQGKVKRMGGKERVREGS